LHVGERPHQIGAINKDSNPVHSNLPLRCLA
jgi:hypothetical protein